MTADLPADCLAAADGLLDRRRPEPERRGDPGEDLGSGVLVGGPAGVGGGPLPRLRRSCGARLVPVQPRLEAARTAKPLLVVAALEDGDHALDRARSLLGSALGDVQQAQELQLDEHARLGTLVPLASRDQPRLFEHPVGFREPAGLDQGRAELRQQLGSPGHVVGGEGGRALEQADRRRKVASRERPPPGQLESLRGASAELPRLGAARAELDATAVRLLEVIADDLLVLAEAVGGHALEPGRRGARDEPARLALESESYAASRISRWRKR